MSTTALILWGPFASASMLLWGCAALVPIVVHLWNRRRYQEVSWAAMDFLLAAVKKNARRFRIEQLVLLLLRVVIVALLAVALAEPHASWLPATLTGFGGTTHRVLVLDASYSMELVQGDKSLWALAQERAAELVQSSSQGDGFSFLLMSEPPRSVIPQATFDRSSVIAEIQAAEPIHAGADLRATLAAVHAAIRQAQIQQPRLRTHHVTFFSDLQRSTWNATNEESCRDQIQKLSELATLEVVSLESLVSGAGIRENLAITNLRLSEPLVTVGRSVSIDVELRNFGVHPQNDVRVELFVNGEMQDQHVISLIPGANASISFRHRFGQVGEHYIEVVMRDDALRVDNHRWISVPVRESIPVLCIEGAVGEANFLKHALQPTHEELPRVKVTVADPGALLESELHKYSAVYLCNLPSIGLQERRALYGYLRQGGGVVVFPGDRARLEEYNETLASDGPERLLPARFATLVSVEQIVLQPLEYAHPLVAPFRGQERAGLLSTPIWRYAPLKVIDTARARVALATEQGDALLVDEAIGKGRILLSATAASTQSIDRSVDPPIPWTAWPTWPSFVPLIQESLTLVAAGGISERELLVGQAFESQSVAADPRQVLIFSGPANTQGTFAGEERLPIVFDDSVPRWSRSGVDKCGVYQVSEQAGGAGRQLFAVNVDTRESDLNSVSVDQLPLQFRAESPRTNIAAANENSGGVGLFRGFLLTVLGLALLESTLASRWGRAGRAKAS